MRNMPVLEMIFMGMALAMDAFAVAVCMAASTSSLRLKNMLTIAAFFGGFQAIMPAIGWYLGVVAANYAADYDHWIAFILLSYIGLRMIFEAVKCRRCETEKRIYGDPKNIYVLFTLAIATSIDALAVGVTIGCLQQEIIAPAAVIGAVTFAMTLLGAKIGSRIGSGIEGRAEIFGGSILVLIGIKILLEHTVFA